MAEHFLTQSLLADQPSATIPFDAELAFKRFSTLHAQRLDRARASLPGRGQRVLDMLPLLLHCNNPGLPGYTPGDTPSGILNFEIKRLPRSVGLRWAQLKPPRTSCISAVYLMGSAGSIAQTTRSDIDLWVCLPASQHRQIAAKLEHLEWWAAEQGVEVQAFAVDPLQFNKAGDVSFSKILLDEFYRSGCWLAGAFPTWWITPPDGGPAAPPPARPLYTPRAWVDFGEVDAFSSDDIFIAAARELEAAVHTPHKSLLKLALLESYAAGMPPLCSQAKASILDGCTLEEADPYLLLAQRLDAFFSEHDKPQRLEGLRHAWLIKAARGNARLADRTAVLRQAQLWGYDPDALATLRQPQKASVRALLEEDHAVRTLLHSAIHFVHDVEARAAQAELLAPLSHHRLNRTLRALDVSNPDPGLMPALRPDRLPASLRLTRTAQGWRVQEAGHTLHTCSRLAEALCWMIKHGFFPDALQPDQLDVPLLKILGQSIKQTLGSAQQTPVLVLNAEACLPRSPVHHEQPALTVYASADDPLVYMRRHAPECFVSDWLTASEADSDDLLTHLCRAAEGDNVHVVAAGDLHVMRLRRRVQTLIGVLRTELQTGATAVVFPYNDGVAAITRDTQGRPAAQCFANTDAASEALQYSHRIYRA